MLLCQAAEHCAQRRHQCRRGRHQCPRHKNARSQQARQLPQFLFSQVGHGPHAIPCFTQCTTWKPCRDSALGDSSAPAGQVSTLMMC